MEHMGNMGVAGYGSLGGTLSGLLVLLVKLLMVVLVIAIIVGIVIWIKNTFFKNTNSKFMQSINNDPILKTVVYISLGIIGLVIVFALLGSLNNPGFGYGGMMTGAAASFSITGIMSLLVKVLLFVLVISLILALVAYVKKQYDAGAFNKSASGSVQSDTGVEGSAQNTPGTNM